LLKAVLEEAPENAGNRNSIFKQNSFYPAPARDVCRVPRVAERISRRFASLFALFRGIPAELDASR
jgi:hypothetical protein